MQKEINEYNKHKSHKNVTLKYADDAILSTWIGGSVLASLSSYRDQWITLEQYAEHGSSIVHKMCF